MDVVTRRIIQDVKWRLSKITKGQIDNQHNRDAAHILGSVYTFRNQVPILISWEKSNINEIAINTDGSFLDTGADIGGVFKYHNGSVLLVFTAGNSLAASTSTAVIKVAAHAVTLSVVTDAPPVNVAASPSDPPPAQPNRCSTCRKRVGLTGFKCRCGITFCSLHRYPEKHGCSYDFKVVGQEAIKKANPLIKAEKLDKI
ncbi:Zinc finger a20 and an1 domain-containing stress-associated protein [Thalictrum thalictroides]|uniref:Zinc finger a20 and an1 domain-containing stress-associated protein n=1 Tax=Thalictrum thalictroides TaxID=46969 RepID=A0A7J6VFI6_THATH|nr:Zinc finger a20 and an1 domain-containing stress-associated protein [Thalictrum thalictroides]